RRAREQSGRRRRGTAGERAARRAGPGHAGRQAARLQRALRQTPGLVNVTTSAPVGQPQLVVDVDQARAADLGVTPASVATTVRTAFSGVVATKFQKADATLEDVRLQLDNTARTDISTVGELPIQVDSGQTVPLRALATVSQTSGPT